MRCDTFCANLVVFEHIDLEESKYFVLLVMTGEFHAESREKIITS